MQWRLALLVGAALLVATASDGSACASGDADGIRRVLAALPSAELALLAELVGGQPASSAAAAGRDATIQELACSTTGDRRGLLLHALAELGHPPAPPRPFVYFLQIGEDSRLRGVSTALLCLLLQGLSSGPSPMTDAGVVACHRFERYCTRYHPGTRVEMWIGGEDNTIPREWHSGTVLRSDVQHRHGGVLAGTMTVEVHMHISMPCMDVYLKLHTCMHAHAYVMHACAHAHTHAEYMSVHPFMHPSIHGHIHQFPYIHSCILPSMDTYINAFKHACMHAECLTYMYHTIPYTHRSTADLEK